MKPRWECTECGASNSYWQTPCKNCGITHLQHTKLIKERSDNGSKVPCSDRVRQAKRISPWQINRKAEYTERGMKRLKCIRCGKGAKYQWSICADGNNYRPICLDCDIALNRAVLKFMRHPHANQKADEYEASKRDA